MFFKIYSKFLTVLFLVSIVSFSTACNISYMVKAAYEESRILLAREEITEILSDEKTSDDIKEKLGLVLRARQYSQEIGLDPKDSYTTYVESSNDVLAWIFMASKQDSFELVTWWYPIVGRVPYQGFFKKEDAVALSLKLEAQGLESSIRSTDAFSTLGWFSDPIMSPSLKQNHVQLANTVIHEITHNTFWLPGHVAFNETLANFVGQEASKQFFLKVANEAYSNTTTCQFEFCEGKIAKKYLQSALKSQRIELELSEVLTDLISQLNSLYTSPDKSRSEKLVERKTIFNNVLTPFKKKYPQSKILPEINNAEIMQIQIYFTNLSKFLDLYLSCDSSWVQYFAEIEKLITKCKALGDDCHPFKLLESTSCSPLNMN